MYITKLLLPGSDLTDAYAVRTAVFVREQGFSAEIEIDDIDKTAHHIVFYDASKPVATGRIFAQTPGDNSVYVIGRVAVLKEYRSAGIGVKLMDKLEGCAKSFGAARTVLGAQLQAKAFYAKCGYTEFGGQYMEENCPHVHMEKKL